MTGDPPESRKPEDLRIRDSSSLPGYVLHADRRVRTEGPEWLPRYI
eukprot:CAMPEP_0184292084 /NCGR_PEP_ID=MMETSP1049-20130417/3934_1 /TAXON_ID=77928 /ORGANISM="Proteomonas sulcata, Strain CCMP704" /LENGTH=45 /DNA_ID= /DNA_START= /DNA_END= /DNA_ORIENTATION=